jgi:hypothetical protein
MKKLLVSFICLTSFFLNSQTWGPATPFPGPSGGTGGNTEPLAIHCLLNFNNNLYVGGNFSQIVGIVAYGIAKWDGINWSTFSQSSTVSNVVDMIEFNGSLFFSGNKFYKWDGNTTQEFSYFNTTYQTNKIVQSTDLHVYNNELYMIANNPEIILKFDGQSFTEINIDNNIGNLLSLDHFNNQLYVSTSNGLFKYINSTWQNCSGITVSDPKIYDIEVYNNELYAIGNFNSIGGITVNNIAKYNGNNWINITMPEGYWPAIFPVTGTHNILNVINGNLFVAAEFATMQAFTINPSPVYKFDGNSWIRVGLNNHCSYGGGFSGKATELFNGELYCGGSFFSFSDNINCQNSYLIERLAKLNPNAAIIEDLGSETRFEIYPNPTSHSITIKGETNMNQSFQIFDQMGREVISGKLNGISTEVNLSTLSKGMYTLKIEGNYQPAQIVKE